MLPLLDRFYFTRKLLQLLSVSVGVSVTPVSQLNVSLTFCDVWETAEHFSGGIVFISG